MTRTAMPAATRPRIDPGERGSKNDNAMNRDPALSVGETYSRVGAEAGTIEAGRSLVVLIEQIVDPREGRDILIDDVVSRHIDHRIPRRRKPRYGEVAICLDPRPDIEHGRG